MAQQGESTWTQWEDEGGGNRNMAAGAILASAVAAGVIAYLLRRARQEEERTPAGLAGKAMDRTRDVVGDDRIEAGRDFLMNKIVPEFKPALLAILEELQDVVDDAFKRAEKAIKSM
jgi:hypothetical protein